MSEKDVFDIITKLKIKRSFGFDGSKWKQACVTPLHKKSERFQRKNYRPVALLCVPGMILERVVAIQINRFFEENSLFGNWMFAYRENKSITNELLALF